MEIQLTRATDPTAMAIYGHSQEDLKGVRCPLPIYADPTDLSIHLAFIPSIYTGVQRYPVVQNPRSKRYTHILYGHVNIWAYTDDIRDLTYCIQALKRYGVAYRDLHIWAQKRQIQMGTTGVLPKLGGATQFMKCHLILYFMVFLCLFQDI